jgi:hypothetical protein
VNEVYFACTACRIYIDAGYRHAYWELEDTGIVDRSAAVDSAAVLSAPTYWDVEEDWLVELLPNVRRFLETHRDHLLRYGDADELKIPFNSSEGLFEWLIEGGFQELPRYYSERLGYRTWEEVVAHVSASTFPPSWWEDENEREAAKRKFMTIVADSPSSSNNAV